MRKARVLVVEDHPATGRGLKMYLGSMGYSVNVAESCASARRYAERCVFDVLVCDIRLGDGTGWDLLKDLAACGPVQAIAYSGYDEPDYVDRSKRAGFIDHVVKGSPPELLVEAIERCLASRSNGGGAPSRQSPPWQSATGRKSFISACAERE
jgi:DNA-binding NtrC family response regulator